MSQNHAYLQEFLKEINHSVMLIHEFADQINSIALKAMIQDSAVNEARHSFVVVTEEVQRLAEHSNHVIRQIRAIQDRPTSELLQELGRFVFMINNISNQINRLALNMALEASATGETGGDCSNLADEIQQLAIHSSNAAIRIERSVVSLMWSSMIAIK